MTGSLTYNSLPHHLDELKNRLEKKKLAGNDLPVVCQGFYNGEEIGGLIYKAVGELMTDLEQKKVSKGKVAFLLNRILDFVDEAITNEWQLPKTLQTEQIRVKISRL